MVSSSLRGHVGELKTTNHCVYTRIIHTYYKYKGYTTSAILIYQEQNQLTNSVRKKIPRYTKRLGFNRKNCCSIWKNS